MRFIVDECTGPVVAEWLQQQGYEVYCVYNLAPGSTDAQILNQACAENWILITNDKDFGELVYREKLSHRGLVFLRLSDERSAVKIAVLSQLLIAFADRLPNAFVVVTETQVRFSIS